MRREVRRKFRASIKPRNILEHFGTSQKIPEHEKIKIIFMKKQINKITIIIMK